MHEAQVSVVITSCGRQDLLDRTISSFLQFNTYPIEEFIVIEDGLAALNVVLIERFQHLPFVWLETGRRVGQIQAIDQAYAKVRTPFIFHCEDDWEFYVPGFIEKSMAILDRRRDILQVWLRALDDTNKHAVMEQVLLEDGVPFRLLAPEVYTERWGRWYGFSFNPGLRRSSDYRLLGSFASLDPEGNRRAFEVERAASAFYKDKGFRVAILADNGGKGYVRHLGWDRRLDADA